MLKEITSLESTSSSISVAIVIRDSSFFGFGRIGDFDLLNLFLLRFFIACKSLSSSIAFECLFYASSFFVCRSKISFFCCYSNITFYCLSIFTSSLSWAFVNVAFSSILGEVMASVTGEEYVATTKAFFLLCSPWQWLMNYGSFYLRESTSQTTVPLLWCRTWSVVGQIEWEREHKWEFRESLRIQVYWNCIVLP